MTIDETDAGPGGTAHVSVLEGQVVGGLRPRPGARLVDATLGAGGHAAALLAAAPGSELLGLDRDPDALERARTRLAPFGARVRLRHGSFADLAVHLAAVGWDAVDGILLDLGVSSMQLDDPARGFSFRGAGPLDMRMDPTTGATAADVVNAWDEAALADVVARFGEEPRARAVARAIVRARPIRDTAHLAEVVARVVGQRRPGHHPATRTFQGIRIAVNGELDALERVLAAAVGLLRPGGRLAVLAYHSLEDRLVKDAFRRWSTACTCPPGLPRCVCGGRATVRLVGARPIRPDAAEIARNPRARSARLRLAERLAGDPGETAP
ncbi:MAG: 16S rRNA (cytosine(1402)-N(4))-methyltransferase RsmH [bacterium]|nr:16S rRNA (cytosine(1402)-N(4))-methyltransferase RsmH [bacterium]